MYKFLFLLFLIPSFIWSQHNEVHPCHQVEQSELLLNSLSESEREQILNSQQELEEFTAQYIMENPNSFETRGGDSVYIIPVVFHIIHAGGDENISDEQVENCVEIMTRDYRKLNADASTVKAEFLPIVADAHIEFRLARKDPSGNCTNGITRTYSTVTFGGEGNERINAVQNTHGNWPGTRYLNVFVAADIGGAAGYTYRPAWGGTGMGNGIHVLHNYVGSIGTSSTQRSRTMTHEVGHWLNLPHTWGNSNDPGLAGNCTGDDGVADTPNTIGWTSCNINGESCGSLDNVQNYMEYSYCSKMFTEGQKARMQAALNSSTGGRNNLGTLSNLAFTGVNEPEVFCKTDFSTNLTEVCLGSTIEFTDHSYFNPTEWSWTFEGGSPETSADQNPSVTYSTPGLYSVTLTAGDGTSSEMITREGYIRVLPTTSIIPFMESFEDHTTIASSNGVWNVNNPGNNSAWEVFEGAGHTGNKSARLNNIGQPDGGVDELISGSYDLSGLNSTDEVTLTFRYSFKQRNTDNSDKLRVLASSNCGETWATRKQILSSSMSLGVQTTSWTPLTQDDWVTNHVTNITSTYFVDGLRIKFEWQHGGGNNIFLDDINLYMGTNDPLSIDDQNEVASNVVLFPNPSIDELTVRLSVADAMDFDVKVRDLSGKELQSFRIHGQPGTNDVMLSVSDLAQGMYMVEIVSAGGKVVKQFIKQ